MPKNCVFYVEEPILVKSLNRVKSLNEFKN